ncbi:hypothetical protein [Erythrobacter alti]|uniref:hypothetical protein n=1 Tax=Erythrobacter alti TaxID=1896145 RepID=UPI0030F46DD7
MTDNYSGVAVVVCSLPRSGTHFLIDILRLNYREFSWRPKVWQSSETLYYNLDRIQPEQSDWSPASIARRNFIVKTHELPFESGLQKHLRAVAGKRRVEIVTPVRPLADQMASYRRYSAPDVPAAEIAGSDDRYYDDGRSVSEVITQFYEAAIGRYTLVDVVGGAKDPEPMLDAIGKTLGLTRNPGPARLPPRRTSSDWRGELKSRLTGRPSSELIVTHGGVTTTKEPVVITDPALLEIDRKLAEACIF